MCFPRIMFIGIMFIGMCLLLKACSTAPPLKPSDICSIFSEKSGWYTDAREAFARWNIEIPIAMAFIRQESNFRADAKPPRTRILWIFPGPRPSSAYGYPQAIDTTWERYQNATSNYSADRDDFADAIDFIGWYNHTSYQTLGIAKSDVYHLYLAYHEGHAGYSRGAHRNKPWLTNTARRVAVQAQRYRRQLARCEARLQKESSGWWIFS